MNKQFGNRKNTYEFSSLKNETNYACSGSQCTCKYLNNRTCYDVYQHMLYNKINNTDYEKNMFKKTKCCGI